MKKSLFTIATAALVLASCSSEEIKVDNGQNADQVAIGFDTYAGKITRAENSTNTDKLGLEDHHTTFAVWGYKDVQDTYVFGSNATTGQLVSYTENTWSYSPIRFWDKNSNSYEFYAAAPQTTAAPLWTLNENTAAQNDDYFTLDGVTLKDATLASQSYVHSMAADKKANDVTATHEATGNVDYMIASPKNVANAQYGDVELDFNHILSRLNVTVKKGSTLNGAGEAGKLNIVSLTVNNLKSTGSFDESKVSGEDLTKGTTGRWTPTDAQLTYTANTWDNVTTTGAYLLQALVLPQTAAFQTVTRDGKVDGVNLNATSAPYIKLVYTIGTENPETFTAYYNLSAIFANETGLAFNEGWQNTLNITIDADAINFVPQVFKWADATSNDFDVK